MTRIVLYAFNLRESTVVPPPTEFSGSLCNAAQAMQWTPCWFRLPQESGERVAGLIRYAHECVFVSQLSLLLT